MFVGEIWVSGHKKFNLASPNIYFGRVIIAGVFRVSTERYGTETFEKKSDFLISLGVFAIRWSIYIYIINTALGKILKSS